MNLSPGFWRGVIAGLLIDAFVQDSLGLEGYIEFCRTHWTTMPAWPWAFAILVLTGIEYWMNRRKK